MRIWTHNLNPNLSWGAKSKQNDREKTAIISREKQGFVSLIKCRKPCNYKHFRASRRTPKTNPGASPKRQARGSNPPVGASLAHTRYDIIAQKR